MCRFLLQITRNGLGRTYRVDGAELSSIQIEQRRAPDPQRRAHRDARCDDTDTVEKHSAYRVQRLLDLVSLRVGNARELQGEARELAFGWLQRRALRRRNRHGVRRWFTLAQARELAERVLDREEWLLRAQK